jgi:anti-sigma factor RsiW
MVLVLALGFQLGQRTTRGDTKVALEAVNNHLRLLDGETPLQVLASDLHQVKPWFAGKLDFAPPLSFKGDSDYPLLGGEVSRFLEQRVAHFVYARRLHKISLFVLPVRGSSIAGEPKPGLGASPALAGSSRGFALVGWQSGEFAYLLVSDLNASELLDLGRRMQTAQ